MRRLVIGSVVAALVLVGASSSALAQRVQLKLEGSGGEVNVGVPFVLALVAEGFDNAPDPTVSKLEIAGVNVQFLGNKPQVMHSQSWVNGRVTQSTRTTHVLRYRLEVTKPGTYSIPSLTVTQGKLSARSRPARFTAKDVPTTPHMRFRVRIPERPIWVGEVFELHIDWYLSRDPGDQAFSIPLFQHTDTFLVKRPSTGGRRAAEFAYGTEKVELPYEQSKDVVDGTQFTRLRFTALVIPKKPGVLELPPAQVIASLQTGWGRDGFGFRSRRYGRFKAVDKPRKIDVRPLPMQGRPAGFDNAVGTQFSINVTAARTVVRVGDPVELTVDVRSSSPVEGLILPKLAGDHGLPTDKFSVPDESPTGELLPDGKTKRFKVMARVKSASATEIPAIGFSYFDPTKGEYKTIRSQPIALSVQGGTVVGAGDVVGGAKTAGPAKSAGGPADTTMSLIGADMSLSSPSETMRSVSSVGDVRIVLVLLYAIPLLLLAGRLWQLRTRVDRAEDSQLRVQRKELDAALSEASRLPARDAAPRIASALKVLARTTGIESSEYKDVLRDLETLAYDPKAAGQPLDASLRERIGAVAKAGLPSHRKGRKGRKGSAAGAVLVLVVGGALIGQAFAAAGAPELAKARATYDKALLETNRGERTRGFVQAEAMYRALVAANPDRPELLTDWGNAALGAHDLGHATLAYRRALRLDRRMPRASKNLDWVRDRAPDWLPFVDNRGAMDSLFFWHHRFTPAQRHLGAALMFALLMLLVVPWGTKRDRLLRRLAVLPAAVFLALAISVAFDRDDSKDAVVVAQDVTLRSADSPGASPAFGNPLPGGAEVTVTERRAGWTRIRLSNGVEGWVADSAVGLVRRPGG